jgi:hypothetical protein
MNNFKLIIASTASAAVTAASLFTVGNLSPEEFLVNPDVSDPVEIRVKFQREQDGVTYQDAIFYTPEEYANLSQNDLDAEKQKRFNNYLQGVKNLSAPVEPTKEQLEEVKANLEKQLEEVREQIVQKE